MTEDVELAREATIAGPTQAGQAHTVGGDDTSRSCCMARGPSFRACVISYSGCARRDTSFVPA
jgi:hypothetical protein